MRLLEKKPDVRLAITENERRMGMTISPYAALDATLLRARMGHSHTTCKKSSYEIRVELSGRHRQDEVGLGAADSVTDHLDFSRKYSYRRSSYSTSAPVETGSSMYHLRRI